MFTQGILSEVLNCVVACTFHHHQSDSLGVLLTKKALFFFYARRTITKLWTALGTANELFRFIFARTQKKVTESSVFDVLEFFFCLPCQRATQLLICVMSKNGIK